MSFVRLFVAWLIIAALPLQGFAAASMMLCDHAGAAAAVAEGHAHGDHHPSGHAGHVSAHEAPASPGTLPALQAQLTADAADGVAAQSPHDHHDGCEHSCSVCASCHVMALDRIDQPSTPADLRSALASQPPQVVLTRATPRPDKPPRA